MQPIASPLTVLPGGRGDKPAWAPSFLPSAGSLGYFVDLLALTLFVLAVLAFLGVERFRPIARATLADRAR